MLKILSKVFLIVFTKNVDKVFVLLFGACFISGCSSLKQNNNIIPGFKVVLGILTVIWLFFIVYALISYLLYRFGADDDIETMTEHIKVNGQPFKITRDVFVSGTGSHERGVYLVGFALTLGLYLLSGFILWIIFGNSLQGKSLIIPVGIAILLFIPYFYLIPFMCRVGYFLAVLSWKIARISVVGFFLFCIIQFLTNTKVGDIMSSKEETAVDATSISTNSYKGNVEEVNSEPKVTNDDPVEDSEENTEEENNNEEFEDIDESQLEEEQISNNNE